MKIVMILSLVGFVFGLYSADSSYFIPENHKLVTELYSKGLHIPDTEKKKIESLLNDIAASTPGQLNFVIDLLIPQLEGLITKELRIPKNRVTNFIVRNQIEYLKNYKKTIMNSLTFFERLELNFEKTFKKLSCYLKKSEETKKVCWEESLADRLFDYCNFEREQILLNYENLLHFIVHLKKNNLPTIINFWSNRELQVKLAQCVKGITPEVTVQFIQELFMFALQSFLMGGNGMYIQWLDQNDADKFKKAQDEQNEIEANFEAYVKHLDAVKKRAVDQILSGFKAGLEKIYKERKNANDALLKEEMYLSKSINLSYPAIKSLIMPPVPYDQMFEAAIMNTPQRHQWYNIYQQGDWEFDIKTNSFFQNELVSFGTPFWQEGFMVLQKPGQSSKSYMSDPSRNSIFTEYISNDKSYAVSVECTLINCSYPFFVGIMFNKGRWISGDPERIWQYRLVGFYGNETRVNDPSTRFIKLGFAQQIITFDKKEEKILSPLEQIAKANLSDQNILFYTMPKKDIDLLVKDAITFDFVISTSLETATVTVSKKGGEQLVQKTFNNLNSTLALFGGIGFICAGAQAEFKIIKPEKLVFSSEEKQ